MLVNRRPTVFEAGIVKWVAIPILLLGLVYMVGARTYGGIKCEQICEEKGYSEGTHIPPDRFGFGEKCLCEEPVSPGQHEPRLEIPLAK